MAFPLLVGSLAICSVSHKTVKIARLDIYKRQTSSLKVLLEEKTNVPMGNLTNHRQGLVILVGVMVS